MRELDIFNFSESIVRVALDENGDTWFVAMDVCNAIGVGTEQTRRLDDDEKGLHTMQTPGGEQNVVVINESGLYSLILTSRKPEAKKFKKWVTSEVLPSIRKTGSYAVPQNYSEALKLAYEQSLIIEDQSRRLIEKDNLILAGNEASIKAGEILVREFVKSVDIIDLGEKQFYEWMRGQGFVLKNSCEPDGALVKRGYFTWKPTDIEHGGRYRYTLRITPRGKVWLSARYLAWIDSQLDAA